MSVYALEDLKKWALDDGDPDWHGFTMNMGNPFLDSLCDSMPYGSGFDSGNWHWDLFKNGKVRLYGEFHFMNVHGYYDGWFKFSVTFPLDDPMDFRLMFHDPPHRRGTEILREFLEDTMAYSLEFLSYREGMPVTYTVYMADRKDGPIEHRPGFIRSIDKNKLSAVVENLDREIVLETRLCNLLERVDD